MYKDFYNNKLVPFVNKVRMACNTGEIPLVFDNSLTYYEQIAAFSAKLNDVISTVNVQSLTLCEFMQQLTEAFKELSDDFATQWAEIQTAFAQLRVRVNVLDERVTALENLPLGVGLQIPEGTQYEYDDETYTAGNNCEIFGCYETQGDNAKNEAAGNYSHAEGVGTKAYFTESHAEGKETITLARASHAEGIGSQTQAQASHAEGSYTTTSEFAAHAEGESSTASGRASHAEGYQTIAEGLHSHAEGDGSHALGLGSHAGGKDTVATGNYSRAFGEGTKATRDNSLAFGKYNVEDTDGTAVLIIGNGTADADRSDLFKILADGKFQFGNSYPPFSPLIDHKSMYDTGVVISNTTDLNTLVEPGKYFASDISNMPNKPTAIQGGSATIKVEYMGTDSHHDFYLQTLMSPSNGVYQRVITSDSSMLTTWKLTFNPYA